MKVALVHDYLNQFGGGERVLEVLIQMFPDAPVYTLLYDAERTYGRFANSRIIASRFNVPFVRRNHRPFIPLMPLAARTLNLGSDFDLIISDTAGYAKGITYDPGRTFHLSYIHTPVRYAWEAGNYFPSALFTALAAPAFAALRAWDRRAAQAPDVLLANSRYVAEKVRTYYGREATVVYPPLDTDFFSYGAAVPPGDYFLAVGRLLWYKKFDLILEAFAGTPHQLVIAGAGPEMQKLKVQSERLNVHANFLGFVRDDADLRNLYRRARALIFPQIEDFGLVAAEAIACGTPVIAFKGGGVPEIITEGENGCFFREQTPAALRSAIGAFAGMRFSRAAVAATAARFEAPRFETAIRATIRQHLHR